MPHLKGILVTAAVTIVVLLAVQNGLVPGIDFTKVKAKAAG